jgi:hypothetical protein
MNLFDFIILFIVLYFAKKIGDIYIDNKLLNYKHLNNAPKHLQYLVDFRRFANVLIILAILSVLFFYKTNIYLKVACWLMLINMSLYFILHERLINLFLPERDRDSKIIDQIDMYTHHIINYLMIGWLFYALFSIFRPI